MWISGRAARLYASDVMPASLERASEGARVASSAGQLESLCERMRGGLGCSGTGGLDALAQRHRAEVKSEKRGMGFMVRVARMPCP